MSGDDEDLGGGGDDRVTPVAESNTSFEAAKLLTYELDTLARQRYQVQLPPVSDADLEDDFKIVRGYFREIVSRAVRPERETCEQFRRDLEHTERRLKALEAELITARNAMRTEE